MIKLKTTDRIMIFARRITGVLSIAAKSVLLVVALTGVFLYTRVGTPTPVRAATSDTLNFQARLLTSSGSLIPDGNYNIQFKLYDSLAAGGSAQGVCVGGATDDCVWMETRTGGNVVIVKNGYISANLGSVTAFGAINWDQDLYLTMNIGGIGGPSWDGEMSPRIKLTAVPYALKAGGLTNFNGTQSGNLSFNTVANSPNILLPDVAGTNNLLLQSGTTLFSQGSIPFTDSTGRLTQDNGNFFFDDTNNTLGIGTTRAGAINGTGNSRLVVKGSGNTSGTSSLNVTNNSDVSILLVRDDGRVGIGTTDPSHTLSVGTGTTNNFNVAGATGTVTTAGGYTQSGTLTNTFSGVSTFSAAGTALAVTNNADIGGTLFVGTGDAFQVSATGAVTAVGVNSGTGVLQSTGGLTLTGATNINTTGTANTQIGNATGIFQLDSNTVDISSSGALTGATGITMASGNFLQTGLGSFGTGSGLVSLNGATSVTGSNTFTSGTGTVLLQGATDIAATVSLATKAGATYTTAGSANNVAISIASLHRLDTAGAAQTITGIVAGRDGQLLTLVSADNLSVAFTLSNLSGSSSAANRISTGTGSDLTVPAGSSVNLVYDATSSLWRVVGSVALTGGGANQQLSNLSGTVAINLALNPGTDNTLGDRKKLCVNSMP